MKPSSLILVALILSSCARRWEPFSTRPEQDRSVIFPVSVGGGLVEIKAEEKTYEMDGEVLRALMIVSNDLFPPDTSGLKLSCRATQQAHTFRFTRRDDVIFVYVEENPAYCGHKWPGLDSGAKYAISKEGRILRRVLDAIDEDDHYWMLKTPDGGTVTVATESSDIPKLEDLEKPDSGILKIITEPVDMPGVLVWQRREGSTGPVAAEPGVIPGVTMLPPDAGYTWEYRDGGLVSIPKTPPPAPTSDLDAGTPDAGGDGGISAPRSPPDAGAAAP